DVYNRNVLSAQCTDKRVNMVTRELFRKYDINTLAQASLQEIEDIIRPCGSFTKKAYYLKTIAKRLTEDYNGTVPNNREYLESLPGVGRKTCNVVLSNLYNVPAIAVDTHVSRVSVRLGFAKQGDDVSTIERKLMKKLPKESWSRLHHQLVLFGRYNCKAKNPECEDCIFKEYCKNK
ncbi:MAG: endonuclease III, partial [Bacilli bacterium]|nr:endonuclease III [Bacilli bacterium]